eukprot:8052092-Alexandrium_andersonii.AAC.1
MACAGGVACELLVAESASLDRAGVECWFERRVSAVAPLPAVSSCLEQFSLLSLPLSLPLQGAPEGQRQRVNSVCS